MDFSTVKLLFLHPIFHNVLCRRKFRCAANTKGMLSSPHPTLKAQYLQKLCGIPLHGRFVSSPSFIYSIIYLYQYVKVPESCSTLCDPMDCTIHGIFQGRILEWVAFPFSRDLPNPGIELRSSALQADSLPAEPQGKPRILEWVAYPFSSRSSQPRN